MCGILAPARAWIVIKVTRHSSIAVVLHWPVDLGQFPKELETRGACLISCRSDGARNTYPCYSQEPGHSVGSCQASNLASLAARNSSKATTALYHVHIIRFLEDRQSHLKTFPKYMTFSSIDLLSLMWVPAYFCLNSSPKPQYQR